MKDMEGKIDESDKKEVEEAIEALRKVKDGDNKEEIEANTKDLSEKISKIGEKIYSSQKQEDSNQESKESSTEEPEESSNESSEKSSKDDAEEGQVVN
jgi:molecular chaperone DnaK